MEICFRRNQDHNSKPQIGIHIQAAYLTVGYKQITPCDGNSDCGYLDEIVVVYCHHNF